MHNDSSTYRVTMKPRRAGEMLDIGKTTYFRLVKEGVLETIKVGRRRMPTMRGIERLLANAITPGVAPPSTTRQPVRRRRVRPPRPMAPSMTDATAS